MENKINIAELLKDCPKGMELDCTICDNVYFDEVTPHLIRCYIKNVTENNTIYFHHDGAYMNITNAKCVIFPKGKTTWEGFQRPFKDGDIIYNYFIDAFAIFCKQTDKATVSHCFLNAFKELKILHYHSKFLSDWRLATEEEKVKFFKAIENNGYCWNEKTKTLVKLPKFNDGDVVVDDSGAIFIYKQIHPLYNKPYADFYCGLTSEFRSFVIKAGELQRCGEISSIRYATKEETQLLFDTIKKRGYNWNPDTKTLNKLIKPIFKKGDKVRVKKGFPEPRIARIIEDVCDTFYTLVSVGKIAFTDQDNWELVPNKFDISKLKPFDKVLVRIDPYSPIWTIDFYDGYNPNAGIKDRPFGVSGGKYFQQCIPYEGNEHLRGTTNDCDDFYKIWEE